jgi:transglutaminase-like putative cysteine protease
MTGSRAGTGSNATSRRVLITPTRHDLVDAAALAALTALALVGFRTTYSGWTYLVAGVAGLLIGIVIAHFANVLRQPMIAVAAMTIGVFFLLGGAVALHDEAVGGILPSAGTLHGLADQSVHGWKDLLTTLAPVDGTGPLLVLPYILGLLGGVGGLCLARRTTPSFAPVAVPAGVLVAVILLGVQSPAARLLQGAIFGMVALGWAALRSQRLRPPLQNGSGRLTRAVTAGALLAVAGAGAALGGPHLPGTDSHRRTVLRSYVQPPLDIGRYPSPLASFRNYTKPQRSIDGRLLSTVYAKPLFRVTGLPAGAAVRIATLDDYNGTVWTAANQPAPAGAAPDSFQRVGTRIDNPAKGRAVTLTVTIDAAYSDFWLPDAGAIGGVKFHGANSGQHATYFRYNLATGTGIVPDKLDPGDSYTVHAVLPASPQFAADDRVATIGAISDSESSFLKSQVAQWAGNSNDPAERIATLAKHLHDNGKYSDGEPPNQQYLPGHYQDRLSRFVNGTQIVGDDEQYAAAFALMVNQLGVPARVVLGATPEADGEVKGKDVHAWVEVQLAGGGWRSIPQTAFMNKDNKPSKRPPQREQQAAGQVVPPPVTVRPRSTLNDADEAGSQSIRNLSKNAAPTSAGFRLPAFVVATVKWGAPPILIVGLCCGLIIALKARRRHTRRTRGTPAARLAKGWREIMDCARDLGTVMPGGHTRREQGALLVDLGVARLAHAADAHVFGPTEPPEHAASAYWQEVERARKQMGHDVGRCRRIRAAISIASLRAPRGLAGEGSA